MRKCICISKIVEYYLGNVYVETNLYKYGKEYKFDFTEVYQSYNVYIDNFYFQFSIKDFNKYFIDVNELRENKLKRILK